MHTSLDRHTGIPLIGAPRGASIELENFITERKLEEAAIWVKDQAATGQGDRVAARALKLAEQRNGKMLKCLELGSNLVHKMAEREMGRVSRDVASTPVEKVWPLEAQLWASAYTTCDKGTPVEACAWIYAAAAKLAGLL